MDPGEEVSSSSSWCCALGLRHKWRLCRVTLIYRSPAKLADSLSVKLVDEKTGTVTQRPAAFRDLSKGTSLGSQDLRLTVPIGLSSSFGGRPRAALVTTTASVKFSLFLVAITIRGPRGRRSTHIPCFSWITSGQGERVFFGGNPSLPKDVPRPIAELQKAELDALSAGDGKQRSGGDRIYEYDVYNDLGEAEGPLKRPIVGGSKELPFPRRLRTGRALNPDGQTESRPPPSEETQVELFWVPEDDDFVPEKLMKFAEVRFFANGRARAGVQALGGLTGTFDDIESVSKFNEPSAFGPGFQPPRVVLNREDAWKSDIEFGWQLIAGMHPNNIVKIASLPKGSAITDLHATTGLLGGQTLQERLNAGRMFMVDHSPNFLDLIPKINSQSGPIPRFNYAPRCLLHWKDSGELVPVAVELMLPGDSGVISEVFTPKNSLTQWLLAKAYFKSIDFAVHEVYSHFLRAHAATEPYIIATRRNLSASHPVFRLLMPHFKDTLRINANARQILINAGGTVEAGFTFGSQAGAYMSARYGASWRFKTEGLPADLLARNMGVVKKDVDWRAGDIELTLDQYPYAEDGLLLWKAMHTWVAGYLSLYYQCDADIMGDEQLTAWWKDIKEQGHPDLVEFGFAKEEDVWPDMNNCLDLTYILVTMIWVASGYHAAMNYSQYDYGGYMPNVPSLTTQPMPRLETITADPDVLDEKIFLSVVAPPAIAGTIYALVDILSHHWEDEVFIGDKIPHWLVDKKAKRKQKIFRKNVLDIEKLISVRNSKPAGGLPYTYLLPNLEKGTNLPAVVGRGIPNSIAI